MADIDTAAILAHFNITTKVKSFGPLGNGFINDSFRLELEDPAAPHYVIQRINHTVFKDVDMLQNNILEVTKHIRDKLVAKGETDIDRKVLSFLVGSDGKSFYHDGKCYWRIMVLIRDCVSQEAVTSESSYHAGRAFGEFQSMLADIPATLGETIPDFHNMEFRMKQLRDAVAEDKSGRSEEVKSLLEAIESRATEMCKAEKMHRDGVLPKRICHCDTKVNNMLFDADGKVLCVIDLDTTMPSFVFSDFGDFMRTAANTGQEDDPNLDNVKFNMEIFKSFTKGYLESAAGFLTRVEIENLPFAAKLFPFMQAVRFLWDYVQGSTYYKIENPEHNLVRAKAQYHLFECADAAEPEMIAFIQGCLA